MASMISCIVISVLVSATAVNVQSMLRHEVQSKGFVKAIEFKHRLRVCNAYAFSAAVDVYQGNGAKLTSYPMSYKACEDFVSPLKAGDKLDFKVGENSVGSFSISDLPNNDAVLLLIIQRHDSVSTAVSFESHVFANVANAQVAVIDTYKGIKKDMPRIMDAKTVGKAASKGSRTEDLRYDSVVAVSAGAYEVTLGTEKSPLVALDHESYVVLRIGNEHKLDALNHENLYPEELVVFPQSDPHMLHSDAVTVAPVSVLALALLALVNSFL